MNVEQQSKVSGFVGSYIVIHHLIASPNVIVFNKSERLNLPFLITRQTGYDPNSSPRTVFFLFFCHCNPTHPSDYSLRCYLTKRIGECFEGPGGPGLSQDATRQPSSAAYLTTYKSHWIFFWQLRHCISWQPASTVLYQVKTPNKKEELLTNPVHWLVTQTRCNTGNTFTPLTTK